VEEAEFEGPYPNRDDIGSVFIYLKQKFKLKGWQNVCYYRGHVTEFFNEDPIAIKWV